MSKTYRWGILGCGRIASKFVRDLYTLGNARVEAVSSRSFERARKFAEDHGVDRFYGSYEEMVKEGDLDVIYIATHHTGHCSAALLCLENNIPVLVEKPMGVNLTEVRKMINTARARQVFLMEAIWTRFIPSFQKALSLVESGALGEVLSIMADFGFQKDIDPEHRLFDLSKGGGALLDIGIYPVFLALLILGEPQRLEVSSKILDTGVDGQIGMNLYYSGGKRALLEASIITKTATEARVNGTKGSLRLHSRWHEPTHLSYTQHGGQEEVFHFDYDNQGYAFEASEVMRCLDKGFTEHPLLPLSFSERLVALLEKIGIEGGLPLFMDETQYILSV